MVSTEQVNAEVTGAVFLRMCDGRQEEKVRWKVGCPSNEQRIGEGATGSRRRCARTWGRQVWGKTRRSAVILDNALGPCNVLSHSNHCTYGERWRLVWQLSAVEEQEL
jgi:hypothetical protein